MKRNAKFVLGLMGIALLATPALAGCGKTEDKPSTAPDSSLPAESNSEQNSTSEPDSSEASTSSGPTYEQVKRGKIEAPDYVVVGDEFDLDDYVTIEGGAGPKVFNAKLNTVSEGVCKVEGHKVKVLKEGTISIRIYVQPEGEEELWSGKFATKSISAILSTQNAQTLLRLRRLRFMGLSARSVFSMINPPYCISAFFLRMAQL